MSKKILFMIFIILLSSIASAQFKREVYDYQGSHVKQKVNYSLINADNVTGTSGNFSGTMIANNFIGNLNGENVSDIYIPYTGALRGVNLNSQNMYAVDKLWAEDNIWVGGSLYGVDQDGSILILSENNTNYMSMTSGNSGYGGSFWATDQMSIRNADNLVTFSSSDYHTGLYIDTNYEFTRLWTVESVLQITDQFNRSPKLTIYSNDTHPILESDTGIIIFNDNISIGNRLDVYGNIIADSQADDTYASIGVRLGSDNRFIKMANTGSDVSYISVDNNDVLVFGQEDLFTDEGGASFVEFMRIKRLSGTEEPLVGIGTDDPQHTLDVEGNISGNYLYANVPWNNLTDYPVSCPAYSSITQLNDSVTCTDSWVHRDGDTMTGQLNIDSILNVTGNTTIGGYIKVGDINSLVTENKVMAEGGFTTSGGYAGKNNDWGSMFQMFDTHHATTYHTISTLTGNYNDTTSYFCDYTANIFNESDAEKPDNWIVMTSGTHVLGNARINTFINSSCVSVNNNPAWNEDVSDVSWKIKDSHSVIFTDEGLYDFWVHDDVQSKFNIDIPNGTGFTGVYIDDVAGVEQHQSLTIDTDIKGYDGIVGLNTFMYSSEYVDGIDVSAMLMEADGTNLNNSIGTFITMKMIGLPENSESDAFDIDPLVNHIIHMGSTDIIDSAYYNDINITANVTNVGNDVEVFTADNDYVYIGNSLNFTSISLSLSTPSSAVIGSEYYYCNNSNEWETLTAVTDTTNGLKVSGTISFINPENRGTCNKEFDGTPFSDANNYTYFGLKRTTNNIVTPPIIDILSISGASTYFILQKDMMKLQPTNAGPETCDATMLGAIYFDSDWDDICVCKSTGSWTIVGSDSVC